MEGKDAETKHATVEPWQWSYLSSGRGIGKETGEWKKGDTLVVSDGKEKRRHANSLLQRKFLYSLEIDRGRKVDGSQRE